MLVISRRVNEKLKIGDVEVEIVGIRRGAVRLGITADRSVKISREGFSDTWGGSTLPSPALKPGPDEKAR